MIYFSLSEDHAAVKFSSFMHAYPSLLASLRASLIHLPLKLSSKHLVCGAKRKLEGDGMKW